MLAKCSNKSRECVHSDNLKGGYKRWSHLVVNHVNDGGQESASAVLATTACGMYTLTCFKAYSHFCNPDISVNMTACRKQPVSTIGVRVSHLISPQDFYVAALDACTSTLKIENGAHWATAHTSWAFSLLSPAAPTLQVTLMQECSIRRGGFLLWPILPTLLITVCTHRHASNCLKTTFKVTTPNSDSLKIDYNYYY